MWQHYNEECPRWQDKKFRAEPDVPGNFIRVAWHSGLSFRVDTVRISKNRLWNRSGV